MILSPKEKTGRQAYVRLTASQDAAVSRLASEAGLTFSEAVRQLIDRALLEDSTGLPDTADNT